MHPLTLLLAGLALASPVKSASTSARAGACSVVGEFGGTVARSGHVTMTNTGAAHAGNFALVITLPNGRTTNIKGKYTVKGDQVTMTNTFSAPPEVYGCIGMASIYEITFSSDCSKLTFNKVSDACPGRIADANGKTLTRVK